jgi:thiol-disulfide isomerase/thioredoxin
LAGAASFGLAGVAAAAPTPPQGLRQIQLQRIPLALPDLKLARLDGEPRSLHALAGKPMVVNFWATWCAPCLQELPSLGALARGAPDIHVVLVNVDRGTPNVERFLVRTQTRDMLNYLDTEGELGGRVVLRGMPTTLLVDPRLRVRARYTGATAWHQPAIIDYIRALLNEPL